MYKASAGAVEYLPVARVPNIAEAIREIKKRGVWVYGLDMDGDTWCQTDLRGALALVVGSEGRGIGRLVREQCDGVVSLPMHGRIQFPQLLPWPAAFCCTRPPGSGPAYPAMMHE